jgi:hypothetical protein
MSKDQLFVERRLQRGYAVRRGNAARATAVLPTQAEAIADQEAKPEGDAASRARPQYRRGSALQVAHAMSNIICHPERKKPRGRKTIHVATHARSRPKRIGRCHRRGSEDDYGCCTPPEDGAWNKAMQFPQQTIQQIVDSEREMVLTASQRFGKYYDTALESVVFATQFLRSIDPDRWVFAAFQALAKNT